MAIEVTLSDSIEMTDSIGYRLFGAVHEPPLVLEVDALDNVLDTP